MHSGRIKLVKGGRGYAHEEDEHGHWASGSEREERSDRSSPDNLSEIESQKGDKDAGGGAGDGSEAEEDSSSSSSGVVEDEDEAGIRSLQDHHETGSGVDMQDALDGEPIGEDGDADDEDDEQTPPGGPSDNDLEPLDTGQIESDASKPGSESEEEQSMPPSRASSPANSDTSGSESPSSRQLQQELASAARIPRPPPAEPGIYYPSWTNPSFKRKESAKNRVYHNPAYLDLLNTTIREAQARRPYDEVFVNFRRSEVAGSRWTSKEKDAFFQALLTAGKDDVAALSAAVGTKSVLECRAYVAILKSSYDLASQEHYRHAGRYSSAAKDMPAAVELSAPCVRALGKQADLVADKERRVQEARDKLLWGEYWKIEMEHAEAIQELYDEEDLEGVQEIAPEAELLNVCEMLNLSDRIFMRDWRSISNQPPSMRYTMLRDLYQLVLSLTRRLVQTSLWLAESRIRAMDHSMFRPTKSILNKDVFAAAEMLKLPVNSVDYWMRLPRRTGLRVFEFCHEMRYANGQPMPYEQLEAELESVRIKERARAKPNYPLRLREKSAMAQAQEARDRRREEEAADNDEGDELLFEDGIFPDDLASEDLDATVDLSSSSSSSPPSPSRSPSPVPSEDDDHDSTAPRTLTVNERRLLKHRRKMEAADDAYLEHIDAVASLQAEKDMWKLMDQQPPKPLPDMPTEMKAPLWNGSTRKRARYLDWREEIEYVPEWEVEAEERERKRRRGGEKRKLDYIVEETEDEEERGEIEGAEATKKGKGEGEGKEKVKEAEGPSTELQQIVRESRVLRSSQRVRRRSRPFEGFVDTVTALDTKVLNARPGKRRVLKKDKEKQTQGDKEDERIEEGKREWSKAGEGGEEEEEDVNSGKESDVEMPDLNAASEGILESEHSEFELEE